MKIACIEPLGISQEEFEKLKAEFAAKGNEFVYYLDRDESDEALAERMEGADVVVLSNIKMDAARLARCPKLKFLSVAFAGIDHIDADYCKSHDITVRNAADYAKYAVAELAIGMMIDLLRQMHNYDLAIRLGEARGNFVGQQLRGKTVGVVGTGFIGTEVCRLLLAFGCEVLAYSRTERDAVKQMGIAYTDLDTLLRQSDIVTLHVPLTQATTHLIGERELALMKPTALLINTARGNVVDIDALHKALTNDTIAGAAIDVYEKEPPLEEEHPLLCAPNCLCLPHLGFATKEAFAYRAQIVFDNVRAFVAQ